MVKFVDRDADGRAIGFYDPDVHGRAIPKSAVKISDAMWREWITKTSSVALVGGSIVEAKATPSFDKVSARIKAMARARIDALFINSAGVDVSKSALAYFIRLASSAKAQLSDAEKADLATLHAIDDMQERIRLVGEKLAAIGDYTAACDENNWPTADRADAIHALIDAC